MEATARIFIRRFIVIFLLGTLITVLRFFVILNTFRITEVDAVVTDNSVAIMQALDSGILFLTCLLAIFTLIVLYKIIWGLLVWLWVELNESPILSWASLPHKLVALFFSILLFNDIIQVVFIGTVNAVRSLFTTTSQRFSVSISQSLTCIFSYSESTSTVDYLHSTANNCVLRIIDQAGFLISDSSTQFFSQMRLETWSIIAIVGFVSAFLAITAISSRLSSLTLPQQFWAAYVAIAVFSIYLALSSILAVPLLSQDSTESPTPSEDIRARLAQLIPERLRLSSDPSEQAVNTAEASTPEPLLQDVIPDDTPDHAVAIQLDEQFKEMVGRRARLRNNLAAELDARLEAAVDSYELQLSVRRGEREAVQHILDLSSYMQYLQSEASKALESCEREYSNALETYQIVRSQAKEQVVRLQGGEQATDPILSSGSLGALSNSIAEARVTCGEFTIRNVSAPSRRSYGAFLGVVGVATSWLLSTESLQVALIVGLIGFGLLGSLVSHFVNRASIDAVPDQEDADQQTALFINIARVVFVGFCAAIIAYLGSYGGIAILAAGQEDPNPYVVFFVCLVGAAFSEIIWDKAKNAISSGV